MTRGCFVGEEEAEHPYYSLHIILSVASTIMGSMVFCGFL